MYGNWMHEQISDRFSIRSDTNFKIASQTDLITQEENTEEISNRDEIKIYDLNLHKILVTINPIFS